MFDNFIGAPRGDSSNVFRLSVKANFKATISLIVPFRDVSKVHAKKMTNLSLKCWIGFSDICHSPCLPVRYTYPVIPILVNRAAAYTGLADD